MTIFSTAKLGEGLEPLNTSGELQGSLIMTAGAL